jgi:hypothetical protein
LRQDWAPVSPSGNHIVRLAVDYLVDAGRLYVCGASAISWRDNKPGAKIEFTVSAVQ